MRVPSCIATVECVGALDAAVKARCVIVHGTADTTIPIEDSRTLSRETGIQLVEVEGGTHGLGVIVRDGRLRHFIETVASSNASKI